MLPGSPATNAPSQAAAAASTSPGSCSALPDVTLSAPRQLTQEFRLAAVPFVERQPGKGDAVAPRLVEQFQGNPPFGPVNHRVRNAGLTATRPVVRPRLGQIQLTVEQAMKVIDR